MDASYNLTQVVSSGIVSKYSVRISVVNCRALGIIWLYGANGGARGALTAQKASVVSAFKYYPHHSSAS